MSQSVLLTLARDSIIEVLEAKRIIDSKLLIQEHPLLSEKIATFVTITINNELRGCIGSLQPDRRLIDDIIANAKSAAFEDPKFPPITTSEYLRCTVEISILTPAQKVEYSTIEDLKEHINVGSDGVILSHDGQSATFLPQVWSELPQFDDFFNALCTKASLHSHCLCMHPEIYTYQVNTAKDEPLLK